MWRRHWKLAAIVGVQLLILAAIPGKKVLALRRGVEVTLRTRPVDPYDLLAGYYVTLGYEVEDTHLSENLHPSEGDTLYVTVERAKPAWRGVEITDEPVEPTAERRSIKATWHNGRVQLDGVGRFYIPEADRKKADDAMRAVQNRALVDMRVSDDGTAALVKLRVGDKVWGK